jgi:hypothetical protein
MAPTRISHAALLLLAGVAAAQGDEGMWTFNNFPADKVEKAYGFRPAQAWLDHVRLSSLRLARGCSGSFVSPRGLVQTNHHCARECIEQLSTAVSDYIANGFYAREEKDEVKCPVEFNQLVAITDVTERINRATGGKDGAAFAAAMKAERAAIASECSGHDPNIRCDVVELYKGGVYDLYKYRRYQDVRLVFAPEESIAFFGGDPDNFEFPRYNLDVSYMRVYAEGRPLDSSANYLRYAKADVQPGDLTFTSGHPGSTHRLDTIADLEFRRDVTLPRNIFNSSELRGQLTEFATKGVEQSRISRGLLFGVENSLKANKGQFAALLDPTIIRSRAAAEQALRAKVDADPALRAQYGAVWDNIRTTLDRYRSQRNRLTYASGGAFRSELFGQALALVRRATEATKPDAQRLSEYTEANFPATRQSILSPAPIYPELEKLTLTFSLGKMREVLGPDDPFVKKVLGKKSPAGLAAQLIDGTGLRDVGLRTRLLDADQAAIAASNDPMIAFVRTIDPDLRAVRKDYEDNISALLTKYATQVAQAMFKVYGTSTYPDATFTLRISYGSVAGYRIGDKEIGPFTVIAGVFERATGAEPFNLPRSWIAAQSSLNPRQPFNFVTTNDIVGGNSGSPVINKAAEVVGLAFDGNIQSLGGDLGYDMAVNRMVGVNVGAIREALSKVYRADRLVTELAN